MPAYKAPLSEIEFILWDVLNAKERLNAMQRADVTVELVREILTQAGHFAENVLDPINAIGDREPPQLTAAGVKLPAAFKAAYRQFCENGWVSLGAPEHLGGQNMPFAVHIPVSELWCSAAMAWRSASGLTEGALHALLHHGDTQLQSLYAESLAMGRVTGTMCLTEPHAGTDLALLRTKAEPDVDNTYRITGTKIYISFGEHDLVDNIIHLVLARLPNAEPGVKGISVFLVPRFWDQAPNGVKAIGIEDKLGIHGSPTCVMEFAKARGYLVGQAGGGLHVMFTMMNQARLGVGLQGLGLMERSLQVSRRYAFDRRQGRRHQAASHDGHQADPISVHPDVRRMLMLQKVLAEGSRALIYDTYLLLDEARTAADPEQQQRAQTMAALLVPIVKAMLTEWGWECTSLAVQIHGGAGYIKATGIEQWLRDARITLIYEGTNGIQALDLLGRKVLADRGKGLKYLSEYIYESTLKNVPKPLTEMAKILKDHLKQWEDLTRRVGLNALLSADEVGAAATDYLHFAGYVMLAVSWLRQASAAQGLLAQAAQSEYAKAKLASAWSYYKTVLPRAQTHAAVALAGLNCYPELAAEQWSS
jgi:alkylation response protein AidB-like acyl-CoA dehydrogenase